MRNCGLGILLSFIALAGAIGDSALGSELDLSVGVGYEFISQEYFLDSLVQSGQDSLAATTALKTTYLDDLKAQLHLKYSPFEDRKVLLGSQYEQTSEFVRAKLLADYRPRFGRSRLDITSELDWRGRYEGSVEPGDDYLLGQTRARLTVPLSGSVSARWQLRADFVDFDSSSSFNYDHYRLGAKAGIGKFFADFSMLDIDLFLVTRRVPDSSELNYTNFGAEGAFLGFYANGDFDLFGRTEWKDYKQAGNKGDYWRAELEGRNKIRLADDYFTLQEIDFELSLFGGSDLISYDYTRLGFTALLGVEKHGLTFGLGGDFEHQSEINTEIGAGDNYFEAGLAAELDYIRLDQFFGSLESVWGYRKLENESDLQSSFSFERLDLIADWKLLGVINLNILLSAEWEWHTNKGENSQVFLVSSGLSYCL